jgi:type I restriction enzyme S subunit
MSSDSLPTGWQRLRAEDVAAPEDGSIVSGPFGSNISRKFFVEDGVPVIRGSNLTLGEKRFVDDGYVYITEEKAQELQNCEALPGDLVFTAAGTLGQVHHLQQATSPQVQH